VIVPAKGPWGAGGFVTAAWILSAAAASGSQEAAGVKEQHRIEVDGAVVQRGELKADGLVFACGHAPEKTHRLDLAPTAFSTVEEEGIRFTRPFKCTGAHEPGPNETVMTYLDIIDGRWEMFVAIAYKRRLTDAEAGAQIETLPGRRVTGAKRTETKVTVGGVERPGVKIEYDEKGQKYQLTVVVLHGQGRSYLVYGVIPEDRPVAGAENRLKTFWDSVALTTEGKPGPTGVLSTLKMDGKEDPTPCYWETERRVPCGHRQGQTHLLAFRLADHRIYDRQGIRFRLSQHMSARDSDFLGHPAIFVKYLEGGVSSDPKVIPLSGDLMVIPFPEVRDPKAQGELVQTLIKAMEARGAKVVKEASKKKIGDREVDGVALTVSGVQEESKASLHFVTVENRTFGFLTAYPMVHLERVQKVFSELEASVSFSEKRP
jgi:hypothetical protein